MPRRPLQPPPRIVVDTNIFVPGLISITHDPPGTSATGALLRAWQAHRCTLVVSPELLEEYEEIMQRPAFGVPARNARRYARAVARTAVVVDVINRRGVLEKDPDDDVVLATAVLGKAEFLVTDNFGDFAELSAAVAGNPSEIRYRGVRVVRLGACIGAIKARYPDADALMRRASGWRP